MREEEGVAEAEERGGEGGLDAEPGEDDQAAEPEKTGEGAEDTGQRGASDQVRGEEETDEAEGCDGGADGEVLRDGEAAVDRGERGEVFIPVGRYGREAGEGERDEVKRAGEAEGEGPEVGGHGENEPTKYTPGTERNGGMGSAGAIGDSGESREGIGWGALSQSLWGRGRATELMTSRCG